MEKIEFKCSGPFPKDVKVYREAQLKAFQLIIELGYPLCMGLTQEALRTMKKLEKQIRVMDSQVIRRDK